MLISYSLRQSWCNIWRFPPLDVVHVTILFVYSISSAWIQYLSDINQHMQIFAGSIKGLFRIKEQLLFWLRGMDQLFVYQRGAKKHYWAIRIYFLLFERRKSRLVAAARGGLFEGAVWTNLWHESDDRISRMSVLQTKFEFNLKILSVPMLTSTSDLGFELRRKISKTGLSILVDYHKGEH